MAVKLPNIELVLYFVIWIISFTFAFYKVFTDGESLSLSESEENYFEDGWKIFDRKKDITDEEWELWSDFLSKLIPWLVFHLVASEIVRLTYIEALPMCYLLTTMCVLICHFPIVVPAFFILQLSLFFLAMTTTSKTVIWFLGVFFLLIVNNNMKSIKLTHIMQENQANLIYVTNGWFYIRCLYFVLSEVKEKISPSQQFFNYLAYIFYLPCFFLGPFVPYDNFKYQMYSSPGSFMKYRARPLVFSIFLYVLYYILYETALHFLYCNAMHYKIQNYLPMGMWTLSGIGICLANFFYLKYVIIYGISSTIAKAENYLIPSPPKCIYRIHLYSNMWRHFDRGFYLFLFRCIYSPTCGQKGASIQRRMFASFLCFTFVYIWHGGTISIFYWSIFNYIGLIIEAVSKYLWKTCTFIQGYEVKNTSSPNLRRFKALAASPLWLLAVISNFMFFGGHEMGLLFIKQLTEGSALFYITLVLIAYSMCQVSIETSDWETKKEV